MTKRWQLLIAVIGMVLIFRETPSFAQFGGRMGEIFGRPQRRSDHGANPSTQRGPIEPLIPDLYEQTEHQLALMEVDLHLSRAQLDSWQSFEQKLRAYASDRARERARMGVPVSGNTAIGGLQQIDKILENQRERVAELEDIRTATKELYAILSEDQKKTADAKLPAVLSPGGAPGRRDGR